MKTLLRNIALVAASAGTLAAAPSFAITQADLSGSPAQPMAATRTVHLDNGQRWINVGYGETVRFVVPQAGEEKTFTWRFDGLKQQLQLSEIAPSVAAPVTIYVDQSKNPLSMVPAD
jgi:hypothetical protein